jgi:hypothetical protein
MCVKITIIILFVIGFLLTSAFSLNDASAATGDITPIRIQNHAAFASASANLEHDIKKGEENSLVQVDSDTYAIAYSGFLEDGYISTFTISADGSTITEVESLLHDASISKHNSLVHVVGDIYALAYSDDGHDGFISTFTIDSAGDITPIRVQNHVALGEGSSANLEHDTERVTYNSLVQVDTDTYALAYSGANDHGFISTFDIDSAGDITPIRVQNHVALGEGSSANLEHDTAHGEYNSLVQVDSDTYAIAYSGFLEDGYISTFTISADGSTITEVESLEHDTVKGYYNSLVHVVGDIYALAYSGADEDGDGTADGFISTFTIDSAGDITPIRVQNHVALGEGSSVNLEHDTERGEYNSLVQVDTDTYALAYTGVDGDGYISTFTISSSGAITAEKTQSLGNNLEHDTAQGKYNSLVQVDSDTYVLAYRGADDDGFISTFTIDGTPTATDTEKKSSSDCYDCKPPTLQESHITILSNDYVVATGDSPLHITASVGDKVTILLNVTDNKSIQSIPFATLYTNYQEKPSDMSAFYANNYDKWKHVSTSFYEWNVRADDVAYDYDGTITWSDNTPTVVTGEITDENYFMINDDNVVEYFMMPFTFTMNDSMETSQITAKIYDASGNRLYETLPVTLEIIPKEIAVLSDSEEIAILDKGDVIITPSEDTIPLLNEPVLFTVLSQWSGYSQVTSDDAELLSVIGLQGDSLPAWTKHLGEWVIQEKLDVSELITAINYVNNQ